MQKNKIEIDRLAKAARITKDIFRRARKKIKPGVRESEIAGYLESAIKNKGLKRSFSTIVASGPNAAKPHARVTGRKIRKNDAVVIDFGVVYKGYRSDMTRTLLIGNVDPGLRKLYKAVETAQGMAINMIGPGRRISDVAKKAHDHIRKAGFGKYILHSLGHGIGVKIHEPPKLSEKNKRVMQKGEVVTVEPGLYIRKKGGVRIEDMVHVTEKGRKVLTR